MAEMKEYTQKAQIVKISATSRASVKLGDSFFTLEYNEERMIPDTDDVDINEERAILWDCVNNEVDTQIADTIKYYKSKR